MTNHINENNVVLTENKIYCPGCQEFKDKFEFRLDKRKKSGIAKHCKICTGRIIRERWVKIDALQGKEEYECEKCHRVKGIVHFKGSNFKLRKKCDECRAGISGKIILYKDDEKKECSICRKIKYTEEYPRRLNNSGYDYCLECFNKTATSEQKETYNLSLSNRQQQEREWLEENKEKTMLQGARYRAKLENLPFNIGLEDIIIPKYCPILGLELKIAKGKPSPTSPSLDKIIPELGYVKGNVKVISYRANSLKNDASLEELQKVIGYIIENRPKNSIDKPIENVILNS